MRILPRSARGIGLGRIGTSIIVGMVILTTLWVVALPFGVAELWWQHHWDLGPFSIFDWLIAQRFTLGASAVFAMATIVVLVALAARFRRFWWIPGAAAFVALAALLTFTSGWLAAVGTHPIRDPDLRADVTRLERIEGVNPPIRVQKVSDWTSQANAFATGFGPSTRVVLWDTLVDGRFSRGEVNVVVAHELAHVKSDHIPKSLAWFALFAFPALFIVAEVTRRRGGLRDPANLPLAVLVITLVSLAAAPFQNAVSRRYEAEADWRALQATHDPAAMTRLFKGFQRTSLQDPNPPLVGLPLAREPPDVDAAHCDGAAIRGDRSVSMTPSHKRRVAGTAVAIVLVFCAGTIGFHLLLDESWHGAFYRTVITATLTGLDSQPRGVGAELLTIAMALTGVAIFGYLATQAVEAIAHEVTGHARRGKRERRMIDQLEHHYIICGYGRVGRRAAEEIAASGQPFVVLDVTTEALDVARERGVLYLEGSGTEDEDLGRAGIDRARGLIASADSDAENVYITLSARSRRPDLMIVARASDAEAERKLRLAGADRVVRPYSTAGVEMAKLALKPQVAAFLEIVTSHGGPDLRFEEIEITRQYPQAGRTIRELRVRSTTGAVIVALRKRDGSFDTTPDPDVALEVGDVLIAIGTEPELRALEELFAPREGVGA